MTRLGDSDQIDVVGSAEASGPGEALGWGEALGYPEWFERIGDGVHEFFNVGNRYFMIPAVKMGLGRYVCSPFTGYIMMLRTRGRKSGEMRDAPLGYVIVRDQVYCMAGFGPKTHWLRNIQADPHVEVVLPDRAFSGIAEEVVDRAELLEVIPALARSMAPMVSALGLGNPRRQTDQEIVANLAEFPIVKIRQTGLAAGPNDPGGLGWIPAMATVTAGTLWLTRAVVRRIRRTDRGRGR